jgi:hypothetical protein
VEGPQGRLEKTGVKGRMIYCDCPTKPEFVLVEGKEMPVFGPWPMRQVVAERLWVASPGKRGPLWVNRCLICGKEWPAPPERIPPELPGQMALRW